jgi:predicted alpha/beta-hydrolase family hydrolase
MDASPPLLWNGSPDRARATVALAHGAGAPMDSGFMNEVAAGLAEAGLAVARFEFPYMRERRNGGRGGAPDAAPVLLETWARVIAAIDARGISRRALVIGGKSLGGRMASMVADQEGVLGLVCLGYPFHPPGRPTTATRLAHMATLTTPTLVIQGTRDQFGSVEELPDYRLSPAIRVHWLADGNHSFKPRKKVSGRTERQNVAEAITTVAAFVADLVENPRAL